MQIVFDPSILFAFVFIIPNKIGKLITNEYPEKHCVY